MSASRDGISRVITEPLGGSALSQAVQARRLGDVQPWRPVTRDEWKAHVEDVRQGAGPGWLDAVRAAIAPGGPAAVRLDRAAQGGIVVTTGQQAGLFGGPLYTLNKALSALALADLLEQTFGVPAAPVFWAATDDADFLEAAVAHVADSNGLKELRLEVRPPSGTPMSDAALGDARPMLRQLLEASGSAAYADYFAIAEAAFTRERTIGDAYVALLRGLLEPLGIAVLDASHPACREAARPVLVDALSRAADVSRATGERAAAIRTRGFEPQVEDDRGLSLVFTMEKGIKRRIAIGEAPAFATRAARSAALAPNVLLRPVVERALMPTVAYVAGPGELAYFAQSNAVAETLDRHRVVGVPRWSCTVIEPFAARALQRLGVEHHEVRDLHALERRLATASVPEQVATAWKQLEEQLHRGVRALGSAVQATSLMPPTVIDGLERSLQHRLARAQRRILAATKRKEARARQDLEVASAALYPLGQRQERVLNYIPMLARAGDDLLGQMRRGAAAHAATLVESGRPEAAIAR